MAPVIWNTLKLKRIHKETNITWRFYFDLLSDNIFNYKAGQFLTCDLPTGEKRSQRWRSYTIANADSKQNEIEFCISYKKNGLASEYFFNSIKVGDLFKCKGPEGSFILPDTDLYKNLFMICTGTGIAPFRAMLQEIQSMNSVYTSVNLIFGTRKYEDQIYTDDIITWNQSIDNFQSHICLSREQISEPLIINESQYHSGYVHPAYRKILEERLFPSSSCIFMICGWTEMIDQAVLILFSELGYSRDQIKFELYG